MSFDFNTILNAAAGDEELVKTLIDIFQEECPVMLANIERAIQDSQPQQLHHAAHKLKGTLGNIGAKAALEQTTALETMGINMDLLLAEATLEQLKLQIEILLQELSTYEGKVAE